MTAHPLRYRHRERKAEAVEDAQSSLLDEGKLDPWSTLPKMNRRADTSGYLAAFDEWIQEVIE